MPTHTPGPGVVDLSQPCRVCGRRIPLIYPVLVATDPPGTHNNDCPGRPCTQPSPAAIAICKKLEADGYAGVTADGLVGALTCQCSLTTSAGPMACPAGRTTPTADPTTYC